MDCSPLSSVAANKASPLNTSTSGIQLCFFSFDFDISFKNVVICFLYILKGSQKIPVNKMVRTDSQDPSGRMHAYLQVKPSRHQESNSGLNFLR